jgi:hypothetical protein
MQEDLILKGRSRICEVRLLLSRDHNVYFDCAITMERNLQKTSHTVLVIPTIPDDIHIDLAIIFLLLEGNARCSWMISSRLMNVLHV